MTGEPGTNQEGDSTGHGRAWLSATGDIDAKQVGLALNSLSQPARTIVMRAHAEAYRYASSYIGTAHLLLAFVCDDADPAAEAVLALPPEFVRAQAARFVDTGRPPRIVHLPYSPHAKSCLMTAWAHATESGRATTVSSDLWWALCHARGSAAERILLDLGQRNLLAP